MTDSTPLAGTGWPPELLDYRHVTPETIAATLDDALGAADAAIAEAIAASDDPGATFDAVLGRIDQALADRWNATRGHCEFMVHVHPDEAVRTASQRATERALTWRKALPLREDVGDAVTRYAASADAAGLDGEDRRILDRWLLEVRRAGYGLGADVRADLGATNARIIELETEFERNLADWQDGIDVTEDDLAGLPESYVEGLREGPVAGTRRVSLDYPDYYPFMEGSPRRDLREALARKMASKAVAANRPILEELLALRRGQAAILGYPSWAHYQIEPRMARTPERVAEFHGQLLPPLHALAGKELEAMAARLHADTGDPLVQEWDVRFYDQRIRAEEHDVDPDVVADYLTLDAVLAGMLALTGRVFGLRYVERTETRAWHPEVRLLDVLDDASGALLGWCYLDLHPRPGKYGHAAADLLRVPQVRRDGRRTPGVSVIMANLPRATASGAARLRHDDVVTLFHEFGHVLHQVLGTARHFGTSMYHVEWDFVEAISQIMENWAWEPDIVGGIGSHHLTGEPMPAELVRRLAATRTVNLGLNYLQWFAGYADFDMAVHGPDPVDLDEAMRHADAVRMRPTIEGTFWPAGFGHIAGGYDAGYYGYLWSLVYGDDLWSRFEAEGIESREVGAAFRREILEPCAVRDAEQLVEAFLGRPSSNAAFLRRAGIELEAPAGG
jgi:Zn-dependent oligopeptidase